MKVISNGDVYCDALSTAAIATIPFIAIGIISQPLVLYLSAVLGGLMFCIFLIRFAISLRHPAIIRTSKLIDNVMSLMQIPYVSALIGMILIDNGIDGIPVIWLSIALAIIMLLLSFMFREDG